MARFAFGRFARRFRGLWLVACGADAAGDSPRRGTRRRARGRIQQHVDLREEGLGFLGCTEGLSEPTSLDVV